MVPAKQCVSRNMYTFRTRLTWFVVVAGFANATCAEADVPAISGQWGRDMLFFEPPASGLGPVVKAQRQRNGALAPELPCCGIVQSWFGDPNNPILRPGAANAVRRFTELSLQGTVLPDLH